MKIRHIIFALVCVVAVIFVTQSCFIVEQTENAIVLRLGEPVRVQKTPGLKLKVPFIEEVLFFENRLLDIELSELEVTLGDRRRIIVDAFARYVINDPLLFFQTVKNETGVKIRLSSIVLGSMRSILGGLELSSLLSDERFTVMQKIKNLVNDSAKNLGIIVKDVRIRRTDLPPQNSEAIFGRMISERQREAKELRAKGKEQAQIIRSEADRDAVIMVSEARKKGQILIGEGEGIANKIYAETYSKDSKFFEFYKSMESMKDAIEKNSEKPKLILNPKGDFFKYFSKNSNE